MSRRGWLPIRWIRSATSAVMGKDVVLVTMLAVTMTLSAFAVYQGTRASDEADERVGQLRIIQASTARQEDFVGTIIDHDLDMMIPYCEAVAERNEALAGLLRNRTDAPQLVSSTLIARGLHPLLLGDGLADCPGWDVSGQGANGGYDLERARQAIEAFQQGRAPENGTGDADLERQIGGLGEAERYLMLAGLLFALALGGLIAVDVLGERDRRPRWLRGAGVSRWRRWTVVGSAALSLLGLGLLVVHAVDVGTTITLLGLLGAGLVILPLWLRRRPPKEAPVGRGRPIWWAEIAGAVALVAFSTAAVGLSLVSVLEREAIAAVDRLQATGEELQQKGEQEAIRDLAGMSLTAKIEAQLSAASALKLTDPRQGEREWQRLKKLEEELDGQRQRLEQSVREQTSIDPTDGCPDLATGEAARPSELYYGEPGTDRDALRWHVWERQRAAIACDVTAALGRYTVRIWAGHGSTLTVALVVLGLAGFLLGLAADADRSARSSRALLSVGAAGTVIGLLAAATVVPDLVWQAGVPRPEAVTKVAEGVAVGSVADCEPETTEALDDAIAAFAAYGPAFERRALAESCRKRGYPWPYLSSEVDPEVVPRLIADQERAVSLGPATPATMLDLGWWHILDGIQRHERGALLDGLVHTGRAITQIEDSGEAAGSTLHIARFNRALALAALDERERARAEYRDAVRCLEPEAACPGNGLLDTALRDGVRLGALADLELISADVDVEDYSRAIMGDASGDDIVIKDSSGLTLDVFRQELQVSGEVGGAAVVWYYRPDAARTWALLPKPSLATLHQGEEADSPVAAGALLEAGEYRADVFAGGERIELFADKDSVGGFARVVSDRLGLSAIVPDKWSTQWDDGVGWHLGPSESEGLTLRRVEGVLPTADTAAFLKQTLADWLDEQEPGSTLPTVRPEGEVWFLGYGDTVVADLPGLRVAAHLEAYAEEARCGGTLFLAALTGQDDPNLIEEVVMERPQPGFPDRPEPIEAEGVGLDVPGGWDARVRPDGSDGHLLVASDCSGAGNLIANRSALDGDLRAEVDAALRDYADPAEFPGFVLESRSTTDVPGAGAAELLVFTWRPQGSSEGVLQWQLAASDSAEQVWVTVTVNDSERSRYTPHVERLLDSLRLE